MKQVSNRDLAIALYQTTQGLTGLALEQALKNFVELLSKRQKLKQAAAIIKEFVGYAKKQEGVVELSVTSARGLDAEIFKKIKAAFGKKVEASEHIDQGLIGGFIVKTDEKIFDASFKTQLLKLKQSLI